MVIASLPIVFLADATGSVREGPALWPDGIILPAKNNEM